MTITITCNKNGCDCDDVLKEISVTQITLNKNSLNLKTEETETLIATVFPDNASNKSVTWTSSNPLVATVLPNGLVTALSEGTATVIVTTQDGNKSDNCVVKVTKRIIQVRFKKEGGGDKIVNMRLDLPSSVTIVEHRFGTENGVSNYFEIPAGIYIPMRYEFSHSSGWYNCFDNPITYDFKDGRKYTLLGTGDSWSVEFHIIDDGYIE